MTGLSPQPPYFRHAAANTPSDNQEVITALRRGLLSADCRNASGVTLLLCAVLNQNFSLAEYLLTMLARRGEAYLIHYMRKVLLRHRNRDYHVKNGRLILD